MAQKRKKPTKEDWQRYLAELDKELLTGTVVRMVLNRTTQTNPAAILRGTVANSTCI